MRNAPLRTEGWARRSLDIFSAVVAAVWPGSEAANDARRLGADEFGDRNCPVEFLVDIPPERLLAVASDLRDGGFEVTTWGSVPNGFLLVRAHVRLRPYHLHRLTTRLSRIVRPYAGLAIVLAAAFAGHGGQGGIAA